MTTHLIHSNNRLKAAIPLIVLVVITALGLALRLIDENWDADSRLHPDERFLTEIVSAIGSPDSLTDAAKSACTDSTTYYQFFNTDCSVYNPDNVNDGSYAYGTLPLFIVRGAADIAVRLNPGGLDDPTLWASYDYIQFVGRIVDGVADALVIVLLFVIGKRLFGVWQGVIAAALYAFAVLPIQLAHFWTVDPLANLFFVIGVYAAVEVSRRGRFGMYLLFGVASACSIASRINMLPMLGLLPLAVLVRLQGEKRLLQWRTWLLSEGLMILGALALGLLVFRVAQPYAFVGPTITDFSINPRWLNEIQSVSDLSRLPTDSWPPSVEWFGRIKYLYPWWNMSMWGMGLVAGITVTLALLAALIAQLWRRRFSPQLSVLSLWVVAYFAVTGNLQQMTMRYYLPLYAPLFLLGAWLIVRIAGRIRRRALRIIPPAIVIGATVISALAFVASIYTQPLTRVQASAWINSNLPTTIDFIGDLNSQSPVSVQDAQPTLQLETALNDESYITAPFEQKLTEPVQLDIQFTDPRPTTLQVQFMDATDENSPVVLHEFDMQTDANGHAVITADQLGTVPPGKYDWHIQAHWDELLLDNIKGMLPPVTLRYFLPIMTLGSGDSAQRQPVNFLNPYQSVPYFYLGADPSQITLQSPYAATVTEVEFAHVINTPGPITFTIDDQKYTATPEASSDDASVNSADYNVLLGQRQRYRLDQPMEVPSNTDIHVSTETPILFTPTAIITEGDWDDSLPVRYCTYTATQALGIGLKRDCISHDSVAANEFSLLQLNLAEDDSDVKYRRMSAILTLGDYFVVSSNRFYDAQPRVPRRFPMDIAYFNDLFNGKLNYELIHTFRRSEGFLGIQFPDQVLPTDHLPGWMNEFEAEEAFTVYDHPTVFVFQNNGFERYMMPTYNPQTTPLDLGSLPNATYSLATQPQTDQDVVQALVLWTIGFVLLGWISFPLISLLFPALPLRGFALGRGLIWLLLSVIPWWLTSFLGAAFWTRTALWVMVGLFVLLNVVIAVRRRKVLIAFIRANWRGLLLSELLFALAFAFGLLLRAINPDLWNLNFGGEKPMDFAYLNATLRTPIFPPPNPWMAGYSINYYYYGFVISALPIKLAGVASEIGYNLVLSTLYAVVVSIVFTLAYSLLPEARRITKIVMALIGTLYAMVAGNLGTLKLIIAPEPNMGPERWYWYPTRILGESANGAGGAINEMPIFSFLYGDLHAHILGLLPTMLFLSGLVALNKQRRWWMALLVGVIAGVIYMTNIWDVLIYAPLALIVLWLITRNVWRFLWWGALIGLGALITVVPYLPHLSLGSSGLVELWTGDRSLLEPFVLVWAIPFGFAAFWLFGRYKRMLPFLNSRVLQFCVILLIIVILMALPATVGTTALCILLVGAALFLAWRDDPQLRFIHLGVALIFGVLLGLEYVVVSGDTGRMNTVFKVSFQLWMWVGLLIPLILLWTLRQRRYLAASVMILLVAAGLLFPFFAIPARFQTGVSQQITLDGNRFFANLNPEEGSVVDDQAIIDYLRGHAEGFPVLAEWYQTEYNWNSRISVQTGLPDIVGWGNHMRQQYGDQLAPMVDQRINDMQSIFTSDDVDTIRSMIKQYHVSYIIYGVLEHAHATPGTDSLLETMVEDGELRQIYISGNSSIFEVVQK